MRQLTKREVTARVRQDHLRAEREADREAAALRQRGYAIVGHILDGIEQRQQRGNRVLAGTTYRGAADQPLWDGWNPRLRHPDDDMDGEREKLIARCRDLESNNPIARALVECQVGHVCGAAPWSMQSTTRADRLKGVLTEKAAQEWRQACEDVWSEAVDTLDARGESDFWQLVRLAYRSYLAGDTFMELDRAAARTARRSIGVTVDLHEGDLCRTPSKYARDPLVRHGVQYRAGIPVAYYLFDSYPDDWRHGREQEWRRVWRDDRAGRSQILHLYRPRRPGQSRGLPWLAPVAPDLEDAGGYSESELMAARAAAAIGIIHKTSTPRGRKANDADEDIELKPLGWQRIARNDEVIAFNPTRPNAQFGAFMERVEKVVAAALGFSSMLALRDFTKANYSVSRSTMMDARRTFEGEQTWLHWYICTVYEAVIEVAWMDGLLPPVPLFDGAGMATTATRELLRCSPIPPAFGWVDPTAEVDAYVTAIKHNLATKREVLSMLGRDIEQVQDERAAEKARERELGIVPPDEVEQAPAPAAAPEPEMDPEPEPMPMDEVTEPEAAEVTQ